MSVLVGSLGTMLNTPLTGGGATLINCKAVNPLVKDKQGVPIPDPCEVVITVNCPEPINRMPSAGCLVTWGTGGSSQQLAIGNVGGSGTLGVNGAGKGTVFSPGICIPLKGDYFRFDAMPGVAAAAAPLSVSIAKGRCPPLQIVTRTPIAGGSALPGLSQTYRIPAYARRFKVMRNTGGIVGLNAFSVRDVGVLDFMVSVVNGAQMDWTPITQVDTGLTGNIEVINDDAANSIQGVHIWWELAL